MDLSSFPDNKYDITLLPDPLYHLYSPKDKQQALREAIDAMDNDTFELFLKYHFATCERKDLLGITSHAMDIFRK